MASAGNPLAHSSGNCPRVGDLEGNGRARGADQWLAALARRSSPVLSYALVTRAFLHQSATTAGYDPAFMAGYAKSVVFPASSTLPELVVWVFGGDRPELAYKLYVLVSAIALPWLVALAAAAWRLRARAAALAVLLFLLYIWTDFPINYAAFGMLPYLLAIPLGLLATGLFGGYLIQGGILRWLMVTSLMSLTVLVHLTAAMVVAPAAALAYLAALIASGAGSPGGRDLDAGRAEEPTGGDRVIPRRFSAADGISVSGWFRSSCWRVTPSGGCRVCGWHPPREPATLRLPIPRKESFAACYRSSRWRPRFSPSCSHSGCRAWCSWCGRAASGVQPSPGSA